MDPDHAKRLRAEFDQQEDPEIRDRVLDLLARWRQGLPPEVYFEEILSLGWATRQRLPEEVNRAAEEFFLRLDDQWRGGEPASAVAACQRAWFGRVRGRLTDAAWKNPDVGPALHRMWLASGGDQEPSGPPPGFDPGKIPAIPGQAVQRCFAYQVSGDLRFVCSRDPQEPCDADRGVSLPAIPAGGSAAFLGSLLCPVHTRNGLIYVTSVTRDAFWQSGQPPALAVDWGEDEFGRWVAFKIAGVRQRMRWIEPGTFRMGSPKDEPGRSGEASEWSEGPQHEVTISRGFWLFDTACTQALWQAVMGENPSRFQSPDRPVEQVSWEESQKFFTRINKLMPGLDLCLPTEAQWEYACRAGSDTATYAGPLDILGECNAPALDPIAWYTGNSGVEFELDNGYDSSEWPNKQYDHRGAGTHPVARRKPNAWGLYDILGNVWEWCHDGLRKYERGNVTDPVGPIDDAERALRGGSWSSYARSVRCALRLANHPGHRYGSFGFRPAQVQQFPGQGAASGSGAGRSRAGPRCGAAAHAGPGPARRSGPRSCVWPRRANRSRRDRATWGRVGPSARRGRGDMPPAAGPRAGDRHGLRKS